VIDQLKRLEAARIQLLPAGEIPKHFVLERGGFVVLVERTEGGFGQLGGAGLLTGHGFAALVWRAGKPFFVAKDIDLPADGRQVEELRAFAEDVKTALR